MKPSSKKFLKICCIVTTIVLAIIVLLVVTLVILYFTVLKPKQPTVDATAVHLRHIQFGFFPVVILEVTLGIDVSIKNPNYAGFMYGSANTSLYYRGNFVGYAAIPAGEIRARGTKNISTVVQVNAEKVISDPNFSPDVKSGMLNITSGATMAGDVILLKYIKLHAVSEVDCDITVFLLTEKTNANCVARTKI